MFTCRISIPVFLLLAIFMAGCSSSTDTPNAGQDMPVHPKNPPPIPKKEKEKEKDRS